MNDTLPCLPCPPLLSSLLLSSPLFSAQLNDTLSLIWLPSCASHLSGPFVSFPPAIFSTLSLCFHLLFFSYLPLLSMPPSLCCSPPRSLHTYSHVPQTALAGTCSCR